MRDDLRSLLIGMIHDDEDKTIRDEGNETIRHEDDARDEKNETWRKEWHDTRQQYLRNGRQTRIVLI